MAFMPDNAPLVVLSFLGTCFLLGLAAVVFFYGWIARRPRRAGQALGAAVIIGGLYITLLVGAALASKERTLGPGEWKYFCEVDCHIAYSIESVRTAKTLGPAEHPVSAAGLFHIVRIKTWFDERSIARWRPRDLALAPGPRLVAVVDGYGNYHAASRAGQAALEQIEGPTAPLTRPLRPGESYITDIVFDLPGERPSFRLLLTTDDPVTWVLIGHEASLFHKKIFFALTP